MEISFAQNNIEVEKLPITLMFPLLSIVLYGIKTNCLSKVRLFAQSVKVKITFILMIHVVIECGLFK
jgi:hypothetical protein